jgi:hypothetical protein
VSVAIRPGAALRVGQGITSPRIDPQQLAGRSAGRAAPTPADRGGLSSVPSAGPRVTLASAGPSAARTQGAALGGAKCKPEDAVARSVSAAARGAWGPAEGTHGRAAVKALACGSASLRALRVTAAQPRAGAASLISGKGAAHAGAPLRPSLAGGSNVCIPSSPSGAQRGSSAGAGALRRPWALYGFGTGARALPGLQPLYGSSSSTTAVAVSAHSTRPGAPMAPSAPSDAPTEDARRSVCRPRAGRGRSWPSSPRTQDAQRPEGTAASDWGRQGPSSPRTQGAALGGAKRKPEDAGMRSAPGVSQVGGAVPSGLSFGGAKDKSEDAGMRSVPGASSGRAGSADRPSARRVGCRQLRAGARGAGA